MSREPRLRSLGGPGSEHLLGETCWVVLRALSLRDPGEQGGQAGVPPGHCAASALIGALERGLWQRVSSATWRLARSIWGSHGASWARSSLSTPIPTAPTTSYTEAQSCLGAGWRCTSLRIARLSWSRPSPRHRPSKAWQGTTTCPGTPKVEAYLTVQKQGRGYSKEAAFTGEPSLCFNQVPIQHSPNN